MKIPNVDGHYATKDGRVEVVVTRDEIHLEIAQKANSSKICAIEEDDYDEVPEPGRRAKPTTKGESPLRKMGKGFTDLSYMLIGGKE